MSRIVIETSKGQIASIMRFDRVGAADCFIAARLKGWDFANLTGHN